MKSSPLSGWHSNKEIKHEVYNGNIPMKKLSITFLNVDLGNEIILIIKV